MENNSPSEKRGIKNRNVDLNSPPAPQMNNFNTIEAQINQQGYQVLSGNQSQQIYFPQQQYQVLQGNQSQQGYLPQQGYQIQQGYSQPVLLPPNSNSIIVNQSIPTVLVSSPIVFGKSPISIVCPRCKIPITTLTEDILIGQLAVFVVLQVLSFLLVSNASKEKI